MIAQLRAALRAITRPAAAAAAVPPIVEVLWEDIFTRAGWIEHRDVEDGPAECRTVGYLLMRDRECVRLSGSWSDDQRKDTSRIPMGVVRSITVLRP